MKNRHTPLVLLSALALAACGGNAPVTHTLSLHVQGVASAAVHVLDSGGVSVFSGSVSGDKELGNLPAGTFTVSGDPVDGFVTPATQSADLNSGDASATLTYVPAKASLILSVVGVPTATVTVKNGSAVLFTGSVKGSQTLSDLPRAVLTISAADVAGFKTPSGQTVDLTSGSGTATLTYTAVPTTPTPTPAPTPAPSPNPTPTPAPTPTPTPNPTPTPPSQPSLTLSLQTPTVTVQAGASAQGTLTVSGQNAPSTVGLQLIGAPSGVSLTPAQVTLNTSAALTFTASASATPGTYNLTLRGTAGSATSDVPVKLVITTANPVTLNVTPSAFSSTVAAGGSVVLNGSISSSVPLSTVYSTSNGLPGDIQVSYVQLNNVDGQPQQFSLTVNVPTNEAAGTYTGDIEFVAGTFNYVHIPLTLVINASGFSLKQDFGSSVNIYAGETANVPVTVQAIGGFSNPVTLQLSGLPSGVTQSTPITVNLNGSDVAVNVPISATVNAAIQNATLTVTGQAGQQTSQAQTTLKVRPRRVLVPGASSYVDSPTVDANGRAYVGTTSGVYKAGADLQLTQFSTQAPPCGLTIGQDGGLWAKTEPFSRYDLTSGQVQNYASPRGFYGCAGNYQFDSNSRDWETYSGLYRLDLPNQTNTKVPGSDSWYSPVVVEGTTVWSVNGTTIYRVDGNSLQFMSYSAPGVSNINVFKVKGQSVYFVDRGRLARFDTGTQTVTFLNVPNYNLSNLFDLDNQGGAWFSANQTVTPYGQAWVRVSVSTGQVLKALPDLVANFSGPAVAPDGGLFYTEGAYLLHVAP